jgi:hypothetical protein
MRTLAVGVAPVEQRSGYQTKWAADLRRILGNILLKCGDAGHQTW